jgi:hypothetical protein
LCTPLPSSILYFSKFKFSLKFPENGVNVAETRTSNTGTHFYATIVQSLA